MSTPRLKTRVPSAKVISIARLEGHKLMFHKKSEDGSGKCDIELTNNPVNFVYGVVFNILASEKPRLDSREGLWNGYEEKMVSVTGQQGELFNAFTYYATAIDHSLKPYHWYKEHVVRGAKEHNLPSEYISTLTAVASIPDPDPGVHKKELSIYQ